MKEQFTALKDKYLGRVFILGSGPSLLDLTEMEKSRLRAEFTFGSSRLYRWPEIVTDFYLLMEPKHIASDWWPDIKAGSYKFWAPWQPTPEGWIEYPQSNHNAGIYGFTGLNGCADHGKQHLHYTQDEPLAAAQVALWLGFEEIYLLGCDGTHHGHVYDPHEDRDSPVGSWDALWKRASQEMPLRDCTPGGRYSEVLGYMPHVPLGDALAAR